MPDEALRTRACHQADEVAATCVATRVRRLGRVVTAFYQRELDGQGVTVGQLNLMTALLKAGPCSPARLGAIVRLEKSTLSRNLRLLRQPGWIEISGRGRGMQVSLTEVGMQFYLAALPGWRKAQSRVQRLLGRAGGKAIDDVLAALDALGAD